MSFAPKQFIRSVDFLSTENAINTSTGCVNIFGGMSVSRDSYLTNMIVVGNSTVTNLNITGTLTTSNGNSLVSSQWTSIDSNTDIYFGTSSNSFVGIGTTTPTFNLDISGGSRITGALTVGNLNVNTGASITNILNTTICTGTVIITAGSIRASFNSHTIGNIFTTGGNVGINTTTPGSRLEVNGTLKANDITVGNINFTGNLFQNGSAYLGSQWTTTSGNTLTYTSGNISVNSGFTSSFNSNTIGNIFTTGGNIGIGTTSPSYRLDVNGSARFLDLYTNNLTPYSSNYILIGGTTDTDRWIRFRHGGGNPSGHAGIIYSSYDDNHWFTYNSGGQLYIGLNSTNTSSPVIDNVTNYVTFATSGNVGIGTTAPTSILDVVNSSPLLILRTSSLTEGKIYFGNSNHGIGRNPSISTLTHGNDVALWTGGGGASIGFATQLTERMRITDTGNVGIGTISPGATLDVSGTTRLQNDFGITANSAAWNSTLTKGLHMRYSTNGVQDAGYIQSIDRSTNTWYPLSIQARQLTFTTNGGDGSERMIITSTGNIGIGTTNPSRMLSLRGPTANITAGPHLWINTSDQTNPVFQMLNWSGDNISMNFDMYYDGSFRNSGSSTAWQLYKLNSQIKFMYQNGTAGSSNGQTNCLVLGSSGNVGIGTATPAQILHIQRSGTDNYLKIDAGGTNINYSGIMLTEYNINFGWSMRHNALTDLLHISYQDNTPAFTDMLTFTRSGNVGINTIAPEYTLDVNGTTRISSSITTPLILSTNQTTTNIVGTNLTATNITVSGGFGAPNASVTIWSLISSLNVSTGSLFSTNQTTTNIVATNISTSTLLTSNITSYNSNIYLRGDANHGLRWAGSGNSWGNYTPDGPVLFGYAGGALGTTVTNGLGKIILTWFDNGNVGIGTTSPRSNLEITQTSTTTGVMLYSGADDAGINSIFFNHSATSSAYQKVAIQTRALGAGQFARSHFGILVNTASDSSNVSWSDSKFFIHGSSGNIGIRTTTPTDFMQVSTVMLLASTGNLTCSGDLYAFGTISDQRLKTNIENIDTDIALNTINQLRPVTFTWKDDIFNKQKRGQQDIGFIAQEVEELIPYAVGEYTNIESGEVYKNMKHERIIPYLTSAIQQLTSRLASLEEQLKSLKN